MEATMTSPTQQAQNQFRIAQNHLMSVTAQPDDQAPAIPNGVRQGLLGLALGMEQLAVGLRATYQLLEKMQTGHRVAKAAPPRPINGSAGDGAVSLDRSRPSSGGEVRRRADV